MTDISDAGPRLKAMNDAMAGFDQMRAEIDRLQAEIDRLRSQPCPYVTGTVTRYCTLTPLTLTDAEREAVEKAAHTATLRGLLNRLSPIKTAESDRPKPIATPEPQSTPAECSVATERT